MALNRTARRLSACLGVLGVLGLALLPAAHIHAIETADGRHAEIVHRHGTPHHAPDPGAEVGDDHHHDEAVFIDSSFIGPAPAAHGHPAAALPPDDHWRAPACRTACATIFRVSFGHDPPWASSPGLRAPPFPLV